MHDGDLLSTNVICFSGADFFEENDSNLVFKGTPPFKTRPLLPNGVDPSIREPIIVIVLDTNGKQERLGGGTRQKHQE